MAFCRLGRDAPDRRRPAFCWGKTPGWTLAGRLPLCQWRSSAPWSSVKGGRRLRLSQAAPFSRSSAERRRRRSAPPGRRSEGPACRNSAEAQRSIPSNGLQIHESFARGLTNRIKHRTDMIARWEFSHAEHSELIKGLATFVDSLVFQGRQSRFRCLFRGDFKPSDSHFL